MAVSSSIMMIEKRYNNESPQIGSVVEVGEFKVYQDGKEKTLNFLDLRGKWVVVFFYPADFTFVCPTELEELADNYEKFKELNTEVISVSTDTIYVHRAWHESSPAIRKIKYPMAADPTARICQQFGVYIELEGLARRGTFIIDPEGKLMAMEVHDNSIGRSVNELLRKLQAAQFTEGHPDLVCPASWTPGAKTLKPSLELVGKI